MEDLLITLIFFFFRHYFAIQTNPGEQFYMFTSLAAWLLRTAGKNFEQPQEVRAS